MEFHNEGVVNYQKLSGSFIFHRRSDWVYILASSMDLSIIFCLLKIYSYSMYRINFCV